MSSVLEKFSAATREWSGGAFAAPTEAQLEAWDAISQGSHTLVVAPTGSGKTLAAFLWSIDTLTATSITRSPSEHTTRVLYISPLKALGVDVERNLQSPLIGITQTAKRMGASPVNVSVGVRSGDTSASDRRHLVKSPPDILITTPESLFLMLTSAARETLRGVETIIVDEIHAVAGTKRGAHLALSLERLDALCSRPAQRIGLSATVRPHDEVARFLGGSTPVQVVAPASTKRLDLRVAVPVDNMSELGGTPPLKSSTERTVTQNSSIWPHVEEAIVKCILQHRSSIVFANSRRLTERLTSRFNEIYEEQFHSEDHTHNDTNDAPGILLTSDKGRNGVGRPSAEVMGQSGQTRGTKTVLAKAHHGSVSKEQRALIEDDLKSGRLRCVVATSSLELGIDMGAVDLVVQVESPPSVASGLQRIGRAGHHVGEISRGIIFPHHRADLIHAAVTAERMNGGLIESLTVPANPLDILAQQTVAAVALEPVNVEEWFDTVCRSAPFTGLPRSVYEATLDLLAGRYPSDEFAELRPRIVWDRDAGTLTGRPGAQRLAVTSGGTIPDRGLFGVFMVGEKATRVGELDEEMVYESRVGDVFALGTTSWRIQEITHDRVLVTPAFGEPGRLPFWKGDTQGRPPELGYAIGSFIREISNASENEAHQRCTASGLDSHATKNLLDFIAEQKTATGYLPTDRTLVVERFRDELGDWRIVMHSPFGMRIHAPWALIIGARVRERFGIDGKCVASDDGIIVRIPDTETDPPGAELLLFDSQELEQLVTTEIGGSALFASRFRECAARALLLPRYNPGKRSPLWQQRHRAAQLLDVARTYPTFPIILETVRECLHDVYDLPALSQVAKQIESRHIRVVETTTHSASPFAKALLFGYVAAFMYEGDNPLAERRAATLSLDTGLLGELLGHVELRELLDPRIVTDTEDELQWLRSDRKTQGVEGVADLLRLLGPLTTEEITLRTETITLLTDLVEHKRAFRVKFAGREWWSAIEDASRLRDALGVSLPPGVPDAFMEPVVDPLGDLVSRFARTHGPFTTTSVAERFGLGTAIVHDALRRLSKKRRVIEGEFTPHGAGKEWCDTEVLRRLRRRSLAALRHEVEPVDAQAFARFLVEWQHVGSRLKGVDAVASVIEQLNGVRIPASAWESLVLPSRVNNYSPAMLDELTSSGEVLWSGGGSLQKNDGWISFHLTETAPLTLHPATHEPPQLHDEILRTFNGGGFFFRQLSDALGKTDDSGLTADLWDLIWAGLITNDTFAPVRALLLGGKTAHKPVRRTPPRTRMYRGHSLRQPHLPTRTGPPIVGGRWSTLPTVEHDATLRAHAAAETLLERYGIVTRGSVAAEGLSGGFALAYRVLTRFEENGRTRRGYYIEGLGAAQFGTTETIDRLRSFAQNNDHDTTTIKNPTVIVLAATDPANPYGAALPWPAESRKKTSHRPGRKAGALIVTVDGVLVFYIERGGKTTLTFTNDEHTLNHTSMAIANFIHNGRLNKLTIEKVNGEFVLNTPLGASLTAAGFRTTPHGMSLRTSTHH